MTKDTEAPARIRVRVTDTDNRDPYTTDLNLSNGTVVEINPIEIIVNMIQNNANPDRYQDAIIELIEVLNKYLADPITVNDE